LQRVQFQQIKQNQKPNSGSRENASRYIILLLYGQNATNLFPFGAFCNFRGYAKKGIDIVGSKSGDVGKYAEFYKKYAFEKAHLPSLSLTVILK
jgi:hypothetical protein